VLVILSAAFACGRLGFDAAGRDAGDEGPTDAGGSDAIVIGDDGSLDASVSEVRVMAVATPTIQPAMYSTWAVRELVALGDGFCATGCFAGDLTIGDEARRAVGDDDAWLACFGPDLAPRWVRSVGGSSSDFGGKLAAHPAGGVVFAGFVQGSVDFGGGAERSFGADDWYVAHYAESGTLIDAEVYGSAGDDDHGGGVLARADARTIVLTGACNAGMDFGGGDVGAADHDLCLAVLDGIAGHVASFAWTAPGRQYLSSAADLGSGRTLVLGHFTGSVDLAGTPLVSMGGEDVVLFIVDDTGAIERVWTIAGTEDQFGDDLVLDRAGNIYLTGASVGDVDFGDGIRDVLRVDGFIASYTAEGAVRWVQSIGGVATDSSWGETVVVEDDVVLAVGSVASTGRVAGLPAEGAGGRDGFVIALEADGTPIWLEVLGSAEDDELDGMAVLADGSIVVAGYFGADAVFGELPVTLPAGGGAVLAELVVR
jgi:hypothetical protein